MKALYDAVAAGMWLYAHAAFRVTTVGPERLDLRPGTLIVSTHRRETDVPVVAPPIYFRAGVWRRRRELERLSFAARNDMFLRGFFAGFPPSLPPRARRLLYPIGVGRMLPLVHVHPLRSASVARLGEALREREEASLDELLPGDLSAASRSRAAACGRPRPVAARDVLRGEYADLLWRAVSRGDLPASCLDGFWSRRTAQAAADFRALVELVRAGGILVVFPEGRPSQDGEIGPVQRGLASLVRRARPSSLQPVAPAYDPLTRGRTRAVVSLGQPLVPPATDVERAVLALLRRTTPLTCGQVVAHHVAHGPGDAGSPALLAGALADAVETAHAEGRNVEPDLLDRERRDRRLAEALAAIPSRREAVPYLAREYESARST